MAKQEIDQAELLARRKKRSLAIGIVLGILVLVFYALTVVKMGPGVLDRPL